MPVNRVLGCTPLNSHINIFKQEVDLIKFVRPAVMIIMSVMLALVPSLASAQVASITPGTTYGPYEMCNYRDNSLCWVSNGVGNQITVNTGNYGAFTWIADGTYDGDNVYEFENASNHCVYVNSSGQVNLISAACDGSPNEDFAEVSGAAVMWFNLGHSGYSYIIGLQPNRDLWSGQETGYYNWDYCSGSSCLTGHEEIPWHPHHRK